MLAETLTQLRVGNQKFLIDFYQHSRLLFARWAQRQHELSAPVAHALLQATLVDFYDQVTDGRLTLLPTDLRAHIYAMARLRLGGAADPVGCYRASGYRAKQAELRPAVAGASSSGIV